MHMLRRLNPSWHIQFKSNDTHSTILHLHSFIKEKIQPNYKHTLFCIVENVDNDKDEPAHANGSKKETLEDKSQNTFFPQNICETVKRFESVKTGNIRDVLSLLKWYGNFNNTLYYSNTGNASCSINMTGKKENCLARRSLI